MRPGGSVTSTLRFRRATTKVMTQRHPRGAGDPSATRPPSDPAHKDVTPGRTWVQFAQNRFWLLAPVLVLDLLLVGRLPPPLAQGSRGPDISGWLSLSETVLRSIVFLVPSGSPHWRGP